MHAAIYECLCIVLLSLLLDIVDSVVILYLYLVKLLLSLYDVFFFFFLLPVMVNKDEYIILSSLLTDVVQLSAICYCVLVSADTEIHNRRVAVYIETRIDFYARLVLHYAEVRTDCHVNESRPPRRVRNADARWYC